MTKSKLVRIDQNVLEAITKLAKENDRTIPRQINRMLRLHPDVKILYPHQKAAAIKKAISESSGVAQEAFK